MTDKPAKTGRPTDYSGELVDEFCRRVASGRSVLSVCADMDMPSDTGGIAIYVLYDLRDGAVRYVGKTKNPATRLRAHRIPGSRARSACAQWARSLSSDGAAPGMTVVAWVSAQDWETAERKWIAAFRRSGARLLNIEDGGNSGKHAPSTLRAHPGFNVYSARIASMAKAASAFRSEGRVDLAAKADAHIADVRASVEAVFASRGQYGLNRFYSLVADEMGHA